MLICGILNVYTISIFNTDKSKRHHIT